jgi:dTDP-4-dehydrorhamnose 3,5-epimerase
MKFAETSLPGVFVIEAERLEDERGFFARTYCQREFTAHGLNPVVAQCNISYNRRKGTLRGLHCQAAPHGEAKFVRCTAGAIYDVILDLRPGSSMFGKWIAVELNAENRRMVYIPVGLYHGYQTLADDTEVFYQVSSFFEPSAARGVGYNDPAFAIDWPLPVSVISERDREYSLFQP